MKKNGFTLAEVIGIIVVLGIIAITTTPIILDTLDKGKKDARIDSAYGYMSAIEQLYFDKQNSGDFDFTNAYYTVSELTSLGIKYEGNVPSSDSWVTIDGVTVIDGCLQFDEYGIEILNGVVDKSYKGTCRTYRAFNGTYERPNIDDTHKGIVYMDPTDFSVKCDSTNSVSTVGTKTGCMKFYVYGDASKDKSYLILDHNTSTSVAWNAGGSALTTGPREALYQLYVDTSAWTEVDPLSSEDNYTYATGDYDYTIDYTKHYTLSNSTYTLTDGAMRAKLITAPELVKLYYSGNWSSSCSGTCGLYFGSGDGTGYDSQTAAQKTVQTKYSWLFDYLEGCSVNGCSNYTGNADGVNKSYWTATANPGTDANAWHLTFAGGVNTDSISSISRGIRPVVKLSNYLFMRGVK